MTVLLDRDKTEEILNQYVGVLERNEYPHNQPGVILPHADENLPLTMPRGGREHAMLLFTSCYWMRGGIKSDTAIKLLSRVYDKHPEIFLPEVAMRLDPKEIEAKLEGSGLGFNKVSSRFWVENARRLCEYWGGDPRNIFEGIELYADPYEELCRRIVHKGRKGFLGFRKKMTSMIAYYLMHSSLVAYNDHALPVDIHVSETFLGHELVIPRHFPLMEGFYNEEMQDGARDLSYNFCRTQGVSSLDLCDSIWLYTREVCTLNPQKECKVGKRRGRNTEITPVPLLWTANQLKGYSNSCAVCKMEGECSYLLRPSFYYIRGEFWFEKRERRNDFLIDPREIEILRRVPEPVEEKEVVSMDDHFQLFDSGLYVSTTSTEPTTG